MRVAVVMKFFQPSTSRGTEAEIVQAFSGEAKSFNRVYRNRGSTQAIISSYAGFNAETCQVAEPAPFVFSPPPVIKEPPIDRNLLIIGIFAKVHLLDLQNFITHF